MGKQKKNMEPETSQEITKFSLSSVDLTCINLEDTWVQNSLIGFDSKMIFNILKFLEIFFAQLITFNGFDTNQAMKSELHKAGMNILNSEPCISLLTAITIAQTIQYSGEFTDSDITKRFQRLNRIQGARNSRYKGIIPSPGMSIDALDKYCIGLKYSIHGKIQTHPVFYSGTLSSYLNTDINTLTASSLSLITPFTKQTESAIKFMKDKFQSKNPYIVDSASITPSPLQRDLGIYIESSKNEKVELIDESKASNQAERQRIIAINNAIKNSK